MATTTSLASVEMYRPEFEDRYEIEYQQTVSRAKGLVDMCSMSGKYKEFPLQNKTNAARKITKKFEDTAPGTVTSGKRRIKNDPYVNPLIFDRVDEQTFGTLESQIPASIANQRMEAERNMDSTIVGVAGEVGGLLGSAIQVDENDTVSYPVFDTTFSVDVRYDYASGAAGADKGMSYDKLLKLRTELGKINVRSQDSTTNNPAPFGLLLGYSQIEDLLQDTNIKNRDYASAKLEQAGEGVMTDVLGFTIVAMDDSVLPIAAGIRTCIGFAKNAVKFGYTEMMTHELDRLPNKTHAIQSTLYWNWGCGRIWDQGVWTLPCAEA